MRVWRRDLLGGLLALIFGLGTWLLAIPETTLGAADPDCFRSGPAVLIPWPHFEKSKCQTYEVVKELLEHSVNRLIQYVLAIAVIFLIITGYQFVTSMGNKQGMEDAKRSLLFIIIGILVVLGAFMVVTFVAGQFVK